MSSKIPRRSVTCTGVLRANYPSTTAAAATCMSPQHEQDGPRVTGSVRAVTKAPGRRRLESQFWCLNRESCCVITMMMMIPFPVGSLNVYLTSTAINCESTCLQHLASAIFSPFSLLFSTPNNQTHVCRHLDRLSFDTTH